jgi:hypothetical protein
MHYYLSSILTPYRPLINPRLNPADMLPVNGKPKQVIDREVASTWYLLLFPLIPGISVIVFESVIMAPSDICRSLFRFILTI